MYRAAGCRPELYLSFNPRSCVDDEEMFIKSMVAKARQSSRWVLCCGWSRWEPHTSLGVIQSWCGPEGRYDQSRMVWVNLVKCSTARGWVHSSQSANSNSSTEELGQCGRGGWEAGTIVERVASPKGVSCCRYLYIPHGPERLAIFAPPIAVLLIGWTFRHPVMFWDPVQREAPTATLV